MSVPLLIIAAVAALLIVLLQMRVRLCISYRDGFDYAVGYMMITYRMNKKEKGQAKRGKKKKEPAKKLNLEQIRQFLELFERIWENVRPVILKIGRTIRIDNLTIDLTVGADDAAQTAVTYGEACALLYPAVTVLEGLVRIKRRKILINADFNRNQSSLTFECRASIRLGAVVGVGLAAAVKLLLSLTKNPIRLGQRGVVK
jgi:Protein of unknown function (DUF2953).